MLTGAYCADCGQKRLGDGDRRLGHLLGQFATAATDLDGRFWRSLRALVLQPGRLSRDYLDGRRRWWLAPMTLFLLANVLYFLAPRTMSDFNLSLGEQMQQVHSPLTRAWVDARVAERDAAARAAWAARPVGERGERPPAYTRDDYARAYDAQAGNVGKALLVVHVPFIGFGLWLMFWRRRMYFAEHLVVATHLFTFTLIFVQAVLVPMGWIVERIVLADNRVVDAILLAATVWLFAYHGLAVRRVYAAKWWAVLIAPFLLIFAMMAGNVFIYRALQFALTYALT